MAFSNAILVYGVLYIGSDLEMKILKNAAYKDATCGKYKYTVCAVIFQFLSIYMNTVRAMYQKRKRL